MDIPPTTGTESGAGPAGFADGKGATGPAPTPVGEYAAALRNDLQAMPKVTITGELADVRPSRVQYYFQLRDEQGGVPCTMWKDKFESLGLPPETLKDGAAIVASGAPDYYPGGRNASPAFSFRITSLRPAGEGDLLARLAALRRKFDAEGLMKPQKLLPRAMLPKRIGVITAEGGAARQDLLVGLERRGWQGEIVWGFVPVQDRKAAPLITKALSDMATMADVEAIVVCRGGGSLTDLWAFCDENLCRTAAMLAVPVISAVGHERDVTLLDDVAAVRCSTPTHAAEAAVPLDCRRARSDLEVSGRVLERVSRTSVADRVGPLVALAGGPARAIRVQRSALNQKAREVRASSGRGVAGRRADLISGTGRHLTTSSGRISKVIDLARVRNVSLPDQFSTRIQRLVERDRLHLDRHAVALRAHDPQRTLERGYARVEDAQDEPIVTSAAAKKAGDVKIHFADGVVVAGVDRPARKSTRRTKAPESTEGFQQTSFEGVDENE